MQGTCSPHPAMAGTHELVGDLRLGWGRAGRGEELGEEVTQSPFPPSFTSFKSLPSRRGAPPCAQTAADPIAQRWGSPGLHS